MVFSGAQAFADRGPRRVSAGPTVVLQAQGLGFQRHGIRVRSDPSFRVGPGLTWVHGGERRGKSSLLHPMAGLRAPTAGTLSRDAASLSFEDPAEPAQGATGAQAWLDARRARHAGCDRAQERRLVAAFGLAGHMAKPQSMRSTGSRRKVGLVGAGASGAAPTLVDAPCAALDAPSLRVPAALFAQAAAGSART